MSTDWIFRVGDGKNFLRSSKHRIWGINSLNPQGKYFVQNVKQGDRLWFVKGKSEGLIIGVATYKLHNVREFGPLIDVSLNDQELGWTNETEWVSANTEIHYTNLYKVSKCNLKTHIKGPGSVRKYNEKCRIQLPEEYNYIVKYSNAHKM